MLDIKLIKSNSRSIVYVTIIICSLVTMLTYNTLIINATAEVLANELTSGPSWFEAMCDSISYNLKLYYNICFIVILIITFIIDNKKIFLYQQIKKIPIDIWIIVLIFTINANSVSFMSQGIAMFRECNIEFLTDFSRFFLIKPPFNRLVVNDGILLLLHFICWILIYTLLSFTVLYVLDFLKKIKRKEKINYDILTIKIAKKFSIILKKYIFDVNLHQDSSKKRILLLVGLNGLFMTVCVLFWYYGIIIVAIYSVFLYFIVCRWYLKVVDSYKKVYNVTNEIAQGNLNATLDEELLFFNDLKENSLKIKHGFKQAVEQEVKSEKMKSELIANISHDLKTPLTAIITYADLLKTPNLTKEQIEQYINVIDKKSSRLAVIIEDLFEISKITSGNVELEYSNVDVVSLIDQTMYELENEITQSGIIMKKSSTSNKIYCNIDSLKMHRVFDNIIINITKYSLYGTRAYISIVENKNDILIEFKNVSKNEITFSEEQIVERFVRGDLSRSTEGSGLGLAISKSFVELHNGSFKVITDGDLFKVVVKIKK